MLEMTNQLKTEKGQVARSKLIYFQEATVANYLSQVFNVSYVAKLVSKLNVKSQQYSLQFPMYLFLCKSR